MNTVSDLKITLLQSPLHWENKEANLEMFNQKISSLKEESDLIILPEMFSTGFTMNNKPVAEKMDGKTIQWMKSKAKEKNCVVTGSIIIEENGNYYNRLIWMRPDASFEQYDKRHLFRYAGEHNYYAAGNKKLVVELNGWKLCPMICYDLRFPVWARNKFGVQSSELGVQSEYDILLYVANWPERRNHPWKTLLMARAIENLSYVIGVNRIGDDGNNIYHSGDSAAINYRGEIISKTKAHEESVETISLSWQELQDFRKIFPAGMDADEFKVQG